MKRLLYTTLSAILMVSAAQSQPLNSFYFMDEMSHRVEFNPSFIPEYGFVGAIPALNSTSVNIGSNLSPKTFLFPDGQGNLMTFLDNRVSSAEFSKKLHKTYSVNQGFQTNLISFGFFANDGGFWSFSSNLKEQVGLGLPGDLFSFLKSGFNGNAAQGISYNLSSLGTNIDLYWENALCYSRPLFLDNLRIGLRLKYLMGLGHAEINYNTFNMQLSETEWRMQAQGEARIAMPGLDFERKADKPNVMDLSKPIFNFNNFGIAGHGFGMDIGATYDWNRFQFSLSANDIGFINWNASTIGKTDPTDVRFSGFENIDPNDPQISIDETLQKIEKEAMKAVEFMATDNKGTYTSILRTNLRAGASYSLFGNKNQDITFGLGYYGILGGPIKHNELFVSAALKPITWFQLTANAGYTFESGRPYWGLALNFSPKWINFFIAGQIGANQYSPQMVPLDELRASVQVGLVIPLALSKLREKESSHK